MRQFVTLSQFVATFSYFHPLMKEMMKNRTKILDEWEFGLIWIVSVNCQYFLNELQFLRVGVKIWNDEM